MISPLLMDRFDTVDSVAVFAAVWASAIDEMARTTSGTRTVLLEIPDIGPSPSGPWTPTKWRRRAGLPLTPVQSGVGGPLELRVTLDPCRSGTVRPRRAILARSMMRQ